MVAPDTTESAESDELEEKPRRAAWPLVLVLLTTMVLGAVVAYYTTRPESVPHRVQVRVGPQDLMIIPGQRVDIVTLGLDVSEVEKRWGKALIRPTQEGLVYQFDQMAVSLMVKDDRVQSVLVKNTAFRTRGGATVGGDVDLVVRELGKAFEYDRQDPTHYGVRYWDKGIHFSVEKTVVTAIQVSEPIYGHEPEPGAP